MRIFRFSAVALVALFPVSSVLAQNLLTNSTFDTDVTGWTAFPTATIE